MLVSVITRVLPAVSTIRAVILPLALKATALSAVLQLVPLPVAATQVVPPSALTCSVSSVASVRLLARLRLTCTRLSLVRRSPAVPVSPLMVTVCVPVGAAVVLVSSV